jgi:hypothetical protein
MICGAETMEQSKLTLDEMINDPSSHFKHPREVLQLKKLTIPEKRLVLESWKVDEWELSTATAENMGSRDANRLPEVIEALQWLEQQESN